MKGFRLFLFSGAVILAAVFFAGCAAIPGEPQQPAYYQTVNQWTKDTKIFKNLEGRLYIYATYKSFTYRRAYVDEYAKRYGLDEDFKNILMERELEMAGMYNEFFIAAFTPAAEWNDFEKDESIWKLYLTDKTGVRLQPAEIEKIDSNAPLYREFFPYLDPWSYGYIVKFPRYGPKGEGPVGEKESEFLKLTVTGLMGRGELIWPLNAGGEGSQKIEDKETKED